jgi:hypothetical protein
MKLSAALIIFSLALIPAAADSFSNNLNWSARASTLYFTADNGKQGADPAPILPSMGFSAEWRYWKPLRLEFTEDIYFTNYEYNSTLGYAMPCNPENRSAFVMGFITGFQVTGFLPLGKNGTGLRVYGGPAADLRLVVQAFGLHPDDYSSGDIETDAGLQTDAIREYFWSDARWFLPVLGAGMDFPINEKFLLGFDLRTWFPVYRLWTDKDLPAIDGWRFGVGIRLTPRKKYIPPKEIIPDEDSEEQEDSMENFGE